MWAAPHGAVMSAGGTRRTAVNVEPARGARVSSLPMSAYGLTERERDATRAVLQGASTAAITEQLVMSTHTGQQHLESIFEKAGVRSRRDLVGKVLSSHYEPRLHDNERLAWTITPHAAGRGFPGPRGYVDADGGSPARSRVPPREPTVRGQHR